MTGLLLLREITDHEPKSRVGKGCVAIRFKTYFLSRERKGRCYIKMLIFNLLYGI